MIFIMSLRTRKFILNMPFYPFEGHPHWRRPYFIVICFKQNHEMCALEYKSLTLATRIWVSGESHLQPVSLYILWTWLHL
jgi:hypothetical protein